MDRNNVTKIILVPTLPKLIDWVQLRDGTIFISKKVAEKEKAKGGRKK